MSRQELLSLGHLSVRLQEFGELRLQHSKTKKQLQDSTTELAHARRRSEQYELEVKKLRSRIEELKDDLIAAENEVRLLALTFATAHRIRAGKGSVPMTGQCMGGGSQLKDFGCCRK